MGTKPTAKRDSAASPKKPRLDPQERLLSRFYEPLVLLYTLGGTRREHTCAKLSNQENVSHMPLQDVRRRFLSELAYMCDYDKGGDTVTAIGLEATLQGYIFWVASNSCSKTRIPPFLKSLLDKLRHSSAATTASTPEDAKDIVGQCITFATPRIKKYRSHLKPLLRKCLRHLATTDREDVNGLAEWLSSWDSQRKPIDLCQYAYQVRKSTFMRTLAKLSTEPGYKSNKQAIHHTFGLVRHYIGRLGHHIRAVNVLLSCMSRLSGLLHEFEVRSIPALPNSVIPPADGMTRLESIIIRMLPAQSPDLDRYQRALAEMDVKHQLSRRFLENYTKPDLKPCVHAEIRVLEQFYASNLHFADNDPFIACSKPACFCCLLYFRNHPGRLVEPTSHRKVYLNWRPPNLNTHNKTISENHQRDILNAMIKDIRKEALQLIWEKTAPQAWHPDSLTGITESAIYEQEQKGSEEANDFPTSAET
ncbi:hypothetical protein GQ44DRAFT_830486 [Phaeosphaeriaceae sp. PMI808]|nr:hypothetical protein GQ44DRAFT_830486 [Phaeosphaeriaceae sp. PMI808]